MPAWHTMACWHIKANKGIWGVQVHRPEPQQTPVQHGRSGTQGVPRHMHMGCPVLRVAARTLVAAVLGVVSRMGRNAQGFVWGMHDTTWNGCQVLVLDTTKEGLLVHVVEGTPSQGDEQAGHMLEMPRGAFWGFGLEGTAPADTEQALPRHRPDETREDMQFCFGSKHTQHNLRAMLCTAVLCGPPSCLSLLFGVALMSLVHNNAEDVSSSRDPLFGV